MDSANVLVVGGGHNGLVAASYLAQAGLHVKVLEQRSVVGGLTTTEEIWPGFWAEPCSQIAHGIEPKIYRDMRLFEYNLEAVRPDPYMVFPFPDGRRFVGYRSKKRLREEIANFSEADVESWFEYRNLVKELAQDLHVSPLEPPPTVQELFVRAAGTRHEESFYRMVFGTTRAFFDEHFESEEIKAVLSLLATSFYLGGPLSGSPYLLLHWAFPINSMKDAPEADDLDFRGGTLRTKGGIGSITRAMAASVRDSGAEILTDAGVERIVVERGVARGVELGDGRRFLADVVVSNVDPKATLGVMVGPDHLDPRWFRKINRLERNGSVCKFIVALNDTPRFASAQNADENELFLRSSFRFSPSMEYQERAYDDAKYGEPSREPIIYGQCPTAIDPDLAPPGKHILNFTVFHAPYRLRSGTWETMKRPFSERILATVRQYMPNVDSLLINWKLNSPMDIEQRYGAPGGSPTHGDMTFARLLGLWPLPGWRDYTTPIERLYLCGSGTWPGGAVTGTPGHNAAHKVLADLENGEPRGASVDAAGSDGLTRGW